MSAPQQGIQLVPRPKPTIRLRDCHNCDVWRTQGEQSAFPACATNLYALTLRVHRDDTTTAEGVTMIVQFDDISQHKWSPPPKPMPQPSLASDVFDTMRCCDCWWRPKFDIYSLTRRRYRRLRKSHCEFGFAIPPDSPRRGFVESGNVYVA